MWDLILWVLDGVSLPKQLDKFSTKWELLVNVSKTNVMVFNSSSRILQCSKVFTLGDKSVESVKKYCYLGIQISLNGSFKGAIDELRKKSLRSFFSLKRTLVKAAVTTSTLLRLFDSLVKPVAMYGCQVWLPSTLALKNMANLQQRHTSLAKAVAKDPLEITHLKMLKWMLGVHRKANNNFCYGDTGRLPWALSVIPQCVRYYYKAATSSDNPRDPTHLLYHTFQEQKNLGLLWYQTWTSVIEEADKHNVNTTMQSDQPLVSQATKVHSFWENQFIEQWGMSLATQSKMTFYRHIKQSFGEEHYLSMRRKDLISEIARIRSSSHDLRIETGRYSATNTTAHRACRYCCTHDMEILIGLQELPFPATLIQETEDHAITTCLGYHDLRSALSENLLSLIMLQEYSIIMNTQHINEFGKFIVACRKRRNT